MEVQKQRNIADILQYFLRRMERIVRPEVHIAPADQICDRHRPDLRLIYAPAAPRQARQEIRRTQDVPAFLQIVADLPPVPGVVSQRDDVRARVQYLVRLLRRDADARGVFAVYHAEFDMMQLLERPEMPFHAFQPACSGDVSDRQYMKFHLQFPQLYRIFYIIPFPDLIYHDILRKI